MSGISAKDDGSLAIEGDLATRTDGWTNDETDARVLGGRAVWWLLVAAAVLGVAAIAAQVIAVRVVDADFIRDHLVSEFEGSPVELSMGDISFNLFTRRIEATDVLVGSRGVAHLSAPRVVVSGIPLRKPARGAAVKLRSVVLETPMMYFHPDPVAAQSDSTARAEAAARRGPDVQGRGDAPAVLQIGRLSISNGTLLALRTGAQSGPLHVRVRDLHVDAEDLALGPSGRVTGSPTALELRTGEVEHVRLDSLMRIAFDSARISSRDASFEIHGPRYEPTVTDLEFFRRLDTRQDRVIARAPRIVARGFDLESRIRRDVVIRALAVDSVEVEVFSNKRLPSSGGMPWLPNTLAQGFEGRLQVDSVLVTNSRIEYEELPLQEAMAPGRIGFENVSVRAFGLDNAPGAPPLVIDTKSEIFGATAETHMEIPLATDTFSMHFTGRVGPFDLARMNPITIPLQGLEIQEGRMEGIRFDVRVEGPNAGGTVWSAYHDLDVQMVSRKSGEGGIFKDIKSFVANKFVLDGDNMPDAENDEESRPGQVIYFVKPTDPFFTRVWAPVRNGLMAVAKG